MEKEESRTEDKHRCKVIVKPEKLSFEEENITAFRPMSKRKMA
jgi:hypothetical protein